MNRYIRGFIFLLAGIAVVGVVVAIAAPNRGPTIPEAELARLVSRAHLVWADYGEGIKAALGATPAALWHGAPAEVRLTESGIEVRFELEPPWSTYDFGFPILLRDPEGRVAVPSKYERTGTGGVYTFRHEGPVSAVALPWVELQYPPDREQRVVFDTSGVWRARGGT